MATFIEAEQMVNINGAWIWKYKRKDKFVDTGLVFRITQIKKRFIWQMVNRYGKEQTGIGSFTGDKSVEAVWNLHAGRLHDTKCAYGNVATNRKGEAIKIEWSDYGIFVKSKSAE